MEQVHILIPRLLEAEFESVQKVLRDESYMEYVHTFLPQILETGVEII